MGLRELNFKIRYKEDDDRLHSFYIPALSKSIRYDRQAGFFSSTSLVIAAQGVARLIQNGGKMRLLVGADLKPEDVAAIKRGIGVKETVRDRLLETLFEPREELMKKRLEVLAWMLAEGNLEIKVVLRTEDEYGNFSSSANNPPPYFHSKVGVFVDEIGNRVGFEGSVNESAQGWKHNYESFSVYFSWGQETKLYLDSIQDEFDQLWEGNSPHWFVLDIPEAVKQELLKYKPKKKPLYDPLEKVSEGTGGYGPEEDAILFQYIKDAPYMPNALWLGTKTAPVSPWPHQLQVFKSIVERFPERFLLCDEVGLGKTIEAGLALRQLVLSKKVQRCLILTPKAVARQWQEELYEKFALEVPLYDSGQFWDVWGKPLGVKTENPWNSYSMVLASSHLAKREDRQQELLDADPWDLIIVDEAHHARRRDFLEQRFRPNRLLELLMSLQDRTKGLFLLTATPMQINPVEVWDLLSLLNVGGRWATNENSFSDYYRELRKAKDDRNWEFLLEMFKDYLENGGQIKDDFAQKAEAEIGPVEWSKIRNLPYSIKKKSIINGLTSKGENYLEELLRTHTPLQKNSFRNTRNLLRDYHRTGLLKENVPNRKPIQEWIPMTSEEEALYRRIEEYISDFYQKYERERKGLGFIMTVYRKRLTSSFFAIKRSLEKRLSYLKGITDDLGLVEEDLEEEDLTHDVSEEIGEERVYLYDREIAFVEDFLNDLELLEQETKVEQLLNDLQEIFQLWDKVIIFTQYTDTMDYLRGQLTEVYGRQIACYSGRGGEEWDGSSWEKTTKEAIKTKFRGGEEIRILLCTEAASEGLNLQQCGVMINYDMPWNPMRVEQRIGRIDRIGQVHDTVEIRNYFYEDTVEAKVYKRLGQRISWFEDVVGELQPILSKVADTIQKIAMAPEEDKEKQLKQEISSIEEEMQDQKREGFNIYDHIGAPNLKEKEIETPVTLEDIEKVMLESSQYSSLFQKESNGVYKLENEGNVQKVTFDPNLFEQYPESLQLLTYGNSILGSLMEEAPTFEEEELTDGIIRLSDPLPIRAFYNAEEEVCFISNIRELEEALENKKPIQDLMQKKETAKNLFSREVNDEKRKIKEITEQIEKARLEELKAKGREVLVKAASIHEGIEGENLYLIEEDPELFLKRALKKLKKEKYPFAPLMKVIVFTEIEPSDLKCLPREVRGNQPEKNRAIFAYLKKEAKQLLKSISRYMGKQ